MFRATQGRWQGGWRARIDTRDRESTDGGDRSCCADATGAKRAGQRYGRGPPTGRVSNSTAVLGREPPSIVMQGKGATRDDRCRGPSSSKCCTQKVAAHASLLVTTTSARWTHIDRGGWLTCRAAWRRRVATASSNTRMERVGSGWRTSRTRSVRTGPWNTMASSPVTPGSSTGRTYRDNPAPPGLG